MNEGTVYFFGGVARCVSHCLEPACEYVWASEQKLLRRIVISFGKLLEIGLNLVSEKATPL